MSAPVVFKDLLRLLLPNPQAPHRHSRFPSQRALAQALNVSENTVGRILRTNDVLDNERCLRLAILGGYPLTLVFTLARRPEIAALIHELTGPSTLTAEDRALLHVWAQLPVNVRATLRRIITEWPESPSRS